MRTVGIILIVLGSISTLGALVAASKGYRASFAGISLIVLGAFLVSRAEKRKENEARKRKWSEEQSN